MSYVKAKERLSRWSLVVFVFAVLATLIYAILLLTEAFPDQLGNERLFYYRVDFWEHVELSLLFVGLATGMFVWFLGFHLEGLPVSAFLTLLILASVLFNLCLHRPMYFSWASRIVGTVNSGVNPFFAKGGRIDPAGLQTYPGTHMEEAGMGYASTNGGERRLRTYPPGMPILYYGVHLLAGSVAPVPLPDFFGGCDERTLEEVSDHGRDEVRSAGWAMWLHLLFIALIPVLTYMVSIELSSRWVSRRTAILSFFIPAFHVFSITESALFPSMALLGVWFALKGWRASGPWWLLVCGLTLSIGLFLTLAFLPVMAIVLLLLALNWERSWRVRGGMLASLAAGWVLGFALFFSWGYNFFQMFWLIMGNNSEFYAVSERFLVPSICSNLLEFSCFVGPLFFWVSVWLFATICRLARRNLARDDGSVFRFSKRRVFAFSFMVVLLMLLLSGAVRGEVSRNWMLLMPFLLISLETERILFDMVFKFGGLLMLGFILVCSVSIENFWGPWM